MVFRRRPPDTGCPGTMPRHAQLSPRRLVEYAGGIEHVELPLRPRPVRSRQVKEAFEERGEFVDDGLLLSPMV